MLRGIATTILLLFNLVLWGTPIFLGGIIKFLIPGRKRVPVVNFLVRLAERWVEGNNRIFDTMLGTQWDVSGIETDGYDGHYLIVAITSRGSTSSSSSGSSITEPHSSASFSSTSWSGFRSSARAAGRSISPS